MVETIIIIFLKREGSWQVSASQPLPLPPGEGEALADARIPPLPPGVWSTKASRPMGHLHLNHGMITSPQGTFLHLHLIHCY